MQTRPSRRASSSPSAPTGSTNAPAVRHPIRSSRVIGVNAICCASHATVSSKSRVCTAPGRAHGTGSQANPTTAAAQPAQLALDDAASATQIKVTPTLDAPIVDLELAAGLPALRANPPAPPPRPPQTEEPDPPPGAEADIDHGRPGQPQQPVECAGDALVPLLCEPL